MAQSSILGGERVAGIPVGKDVDALGPSDSSDSGSDVQGLPAPGVAESTGGPLDGALRGDSDAGGTGERGSAVVGEDAAAGADIAPDRVVSDPDADADAQDADAEDSDVEAIVEELASDSVPAPDIPRPEEPVKGR